MDLGKYLNSINFEKTNIMEDPVTGEEAEKDYNPFIVNRCLSPFPDSLLHVQEMNLYPQLDKRIQYEYYLAAIRKRKRFSKRQIDIPENVDVVKEYFGYSNVKAKEALRILTEEQIQYMKQKLDKGGVRKK